MNASPSLRLFVVAAAVCALPGLAIPDSAHAACNLIPGTIAAYEGAQGSTNRSFAAPGEPVEIALRDCDDSPGLSSDVSDQVLTLVYTPAIGTETAIVLTAESDCTGLAGQLAGCASDVSPGAKVLCLGGTEAGMQIVDRGGVRNLSFRMPDTDRRCVGGSEAGTVCFADADCAGGGSCAEDDNDRTLAGEVRLVVTDATDPLQCAIPDCRDASGTIACIDTFYRGGGACADSIAAAVFPSFSALPPANIYAEECIAEEPPCDPLLADEEIRTALDARGNMLIPFQWDGIREILDGTPVARLVQATLSLPVDLPGQSFVQSYSPEGRRLNPIFEPKESGGSTVTLYGSADAPYTILRIARGTDSGAVCDGGDNDGAPCNAAADCPMGDCEAAECIGGAADGLACFTDEDCVGGGECGPKLFNFASFADQGGIGPLVVPRNSIFLPRFCQDDPAQSCVADCGPDGPCVTYKLEAGAPVPLDDLVSRDELADFAVTERIDNVDRNGDGDTNDVVIVQRDADTGEIIPLGPPPSPPNCGIPVVPGTVDGRAVVRVSVPPALLPAGATEGDILAFIESEGGQNGCDLTGDGDTIDGILRVFRSPAIELTEDRTVVVDPTPVVNDRPIVVSNGRVFFREAELDQISRLTERVSVDSSEAQATGASSAPTTDGFYIAFQSAAPDLVLGDSNNRLDIFIRDTLTGNTLRFSEDTLSDDPNNDSAEPDVLAQGFFDIKVVFQSLATDLVATDANGLLDVFLVTGTSNSGVSSTQLISQNSGVASNGVSRRAHLGETTGGGTSLWAVYETEATNLSDFPVDTNGSATDVVVYSESLDENLLVSFNYDGDAADGASSNPSIARTTDSAFPRIAFESVATDIIMSDTNGLKDVFVNTDFDMVRASVGLGDIEPNGASQNASVTIGIDGLTYVAFDSFASNLVSSDSNSARDVFVRIVELGVTERVSITSGGNQGNGDSFLPTISEDGRYVTFLSQATNLVSGDTNAASDVFVHDRITRTTVRANLSDTGAQTSSDPVIESYPPAISTLNTFVAWGDLAADVVTGDTNLSTDVFQRTIDNMDDSPNFLWPNEVPIDVVLRVFDTTLDPPVLTTLCPTDKVVVADGKAVFLRSESTVETVECVGDDLSGDGEIETGDLSVSFWDGGIAINLGLEVKDVVMSADWIATITSENGPGFTQELQVYPVVSPITDGAWQPVATPIWGGSFPNESHDLGINGSAVAFYVDEGASGDFDDFNSDGDSSDSVLYVYDASTDTLRNTALAGLNSTLGTTLRDHYVIGDRVNDPACGGDVQLVAFEVDEQTEGPPETNGSNLNGSGDAPGSPPDVDNDDLVLHVMDVVSGTVVNIGQAVTACTFAACNPKTPWRVEGSRVTFLTAEFEQGGQDLDGNGDATDLILQTYDFCNEVLTPLDRVDPGTSDNPLVPQDDSQIIVSDSGRCDEGVACDPSGDDCGAGYFCEADVCDQAFGTCTRHRSIMCATDADCNRCIAFVPATCTSDDDCLTPATCESQAITAVAASTDRDRDGLFDDIDNCPNDPNPTQSDLDGDSIGDACDFNSCSDTPRLACFLPGDGKAKLTLKNDVADKKDQIKWSWLKGEAVTKAEFGAPLTNDTYDLCVYNNGVLASGIVVKGSGATCGKANKPCWKETSTGFKYKDQFRFPNGTQKALFKAGEVGKTKALVAGKGINLPDLDLTALTGPIVVELVNRQTQACFTSEFAAPYKKQTAEQIVAGGGPPAP